MTELKEGMEIEVGLARREAKVIHVGQDSFGNKTARVRYKDNKEYQIIQIGDQIKILKEQQSTLEEVAV